MDSTYRLWLPRAASAAAFLACLAAAPASARWLFAQVAITGQAAPEVMDAAEFRSFGAPAQNASEDISFRADLQTGTGAVVTEANAQAMFGPTSGTGSPLGLIARWGQVAPGVADGAEFTGGELDGFGSPSLSASGDTAFSAILRTSAGAGVTEDRGRAIFGPTMGAASPLGLIARLGQAAPAVADGAVFDRLSSSLSLNASGDMAFMAFLRTGTGAAVTPDNDRALFGPTSGAGSPLGLIAREGQAVSVVERFGGFGQPTLNASGDVAFLAGLRRGDGGPIISTVFGPTSGAGSPLGEILREGQAATGAADGAVFEFFDSPSLNGSGDVAFPAVLRTGAGAAVTEANDRAIFGPTSGAGSPLGLIAREDEVVPGAEDGAVFSSFSTASLNTSGGLAFTAFLRTGTGPAVTTANNRALFRLVDDVPALVVREGQLFETINPATSLIETRTIESIGFAPQGFTDMGSLAFQLGFTDRTQGIFVARLVPEPAAWTLIWTLALARLAMHGAGRGRQA